MTPEHLDAEAAPEAVRLHVGYVGMTREGQRVIVISENVSIDTPWYCSDSWFRKCTGWVSSDYPGAPDIIAPWSDDPEERASILAREGGE